MHRRRLVHGDDAECLHAFRALLRFDNDARAFVSGLEAVAAQTGDVQEHVGHSVIGNDEAVALRDVEPFDEAGDLDEPNRCFLGKVFDTRFLLVHSEL